MAEMTEAGRKDRWRDDAFLDTSLLFQPFAFSEVLSKTEFCEK